MALFCLLNEINRHNKPPLRCKLPLYLSSSLHLVKKLGRICILKYTVYVFLYKTLHFPPVKLDEGTIWMPAVKLKDNEPFDVALRRFKRACEKAGVLAEVRSREFYEKPTAERKRKAAAAVKRHAKKVQREQRRRERLY